METKQLITNILNKIVDTVHPQTVFLFGSYANGTANPNSDIDLCIIKNDVSNRHQILANLRRTLADYPTAMDLIMMTEDEFSSRKDIWWTIQGQIQKNGKIIYEKK